MKKLLTVLALFLFSLSAFAQAPDKMSFQRVVRDDNGKLVANTEIAVQISVIQGAKDGAVVFTELHRITTNGDGLASFKIGEGTEIQGTFAGIEWAKGPFFIKTAVDPNGGSNNELVGATELLNVPYAFIARNTGASSEVNNDVRNGPVNIPEVNNDKEYVNGDVRDPGVPSQNWSLFGNSKSDASIDKLGTTDFIDLVMVTDNLERLRIQANGDINIAKSLEVGEDLRVNRNVDLNILGGATVNNGNLTVANASATLLTGMLTVDGTTDLNSSLDVNNAAPTHLTGTLDVDLSLNVDGATTLQSSLLVNNLSPTNLTGTLNVGGATNLQSTLDVNNGAATHLSGMLDVDQSLNVDGATTLQSTLNANGQVTVNANVGGGEGSYNAYPLRVEGSSQGIAIKLTAGTPNNSNNFATFFNSAGSAVGRIEGETLGEATTTPEFIFDNAILVAEEAKAIVNAVSAAIPVVTVGTPVTQAGPCGGCIAAAAADLALATANILAYNVFATSNLGVTYESGGADYAEWLERNDPREKISAGDIVGVNGGKISKYTLNSKQYMVISTKPAMLGNMPMDGKGELFEKVAFMGQIPVKVRGIVLSGDYILPSGLHDGTGVAVSPDAITAQQYREIVGVAWSSSLINKGISVINMAIGLNANDVANLAVQQERRIEDLENKFSSLEQRLLAFENGTVNTANRIPVDASPAEKGITPNKPMTRAEMLASRMPPELSDDVMEEAIRKLKSEYTNLGLSFKDHPGLNRLFTDDAYKAEVIRSAQERYRVSYQSLLTAAAQD